MKNGQARPAGHDGVEDVVDVASKEDLAAGEIDPVDVRVLSHERNDLAGRELVGRLPLPDVARLALVLAPVSETQIELERSRGPMCGRAQQRRAEGRRARNHFGFSSYNTRSMSQGLWKSLRDTTMVTINSFVAGAPPLAI